MKTFHVYHHPHLGAQAVKEGFSWPGFVFGWVWLLVKELWWLFLLFLGVGFASALLADLVFGQLEDMGHGNMEYAFGRFLFTTVVTVTVSLLTGFYGNRWCCRNLSRRGFNRIATLQAMSPDAAIQATELPQAATADEYSRPWYKEVWPWFILGILGMSVVLGTSMLVIATKNPPGLLSDNYYDVGKGINTSLEREELAERLQLKAGFALDNERGTVALQLQGHSNPPQLVLNLISPTQPERDRRVVLQAQGDGSYAGNLLDAVEGRRFVELIGQEGGKDWRLFEEEQLVGGQRFQLGE